jgi:hypothetical protein
MSTVAKFEVPLSTGAGVYLANVIALSKIDLNKLRAVSRSWKIDGVNSVMLDQEQGMNSDIVQAIAGSRLQPWVLFDKNPEPVELRHVYSLGVRAIVIPSQGVTALGNVTGRVHRAGLYCLIRHNTNLNDYRYLASNIGEVIGAGVDGLLDHSSDSLLSKGAVSYGLNTYSANATVVREVAQSGGSGALLTITGINPIMVVDTLSGDLVAHTELLRRDLLGKEVYAAELVKLLSR